MSVDKSYYSAVVIIPPEGVWRQIQDIRRKNDKAYKTWMPHINLMFPFIKDDKSGDNFKMAAARISENLKMRPFTVRFNKDSLRFFPHGKNCTIYLRPLSGDMMSPPAMPSRMTSDQPVNRPAVLPSKPNPCVTKPATSPWQPLVQPPQPMKVNFLPHEVSRQLSCPPPVMSDCTVQPPPSLSNLHSATWEEYKAPSVPSGSTSGLDTLRYAEWTPGDSDITSWVWAPDAMYHASDNGMHPAKCQEGTDKAGERSDSSGVRKKKKKRNYVAASGVVGVTDSQTIINEPEEEPSNTQTTIQPSISDLWSEPQETWPPSPETAQEQWMTVLNSRSKEREEESSLPVVPECASPAVIELQKQLQQLYPEYSEQSTKSAAGFQPHLTLGQCHSLHVHETVARWSQAWYEITFDVSEIYLISRSPDGPHEIQQTIQLG